LKKARDSDDIFRDKKLEKGKGPGVTHDIPGPLKFRAGDWSSSLLLHRQNEIAGGFIAV
jgi:hypothetical protein